MQLKKSPLAPLFFPDMPPLDGVEIAVASVGFKYQNRPDYVVLRLADGTCVSGAFTTSLTRSSAVDYSRQALKNGGVRTIAINAGNSNAFTGHRGKHANDIFARHAMRFTGCDGSENDGVLPVVCCSTGVIGEVLDTEPLSRMTHMDFTANWHQAAEAIVTTDTFAKGVTATAKIGDTVVRINGIAKGSGMIAPDMATMLAYIFTDACIAQDTLDDMLLEMTQLSFNAITVDSDTSTSDSVILGATGRAGNHPYADLADFKHALYGVFVDLATQIVKDGEGASKFITVRVSHAQSDKDAKTVAMAIANSPLVKTAIAGEDANWGRIVMAVGKSGAVANRDTLSIAIGGVAIAHNGEGVDNYDQAPVTQHLQGTDITIDVSLNLGTGAATVWTCDLTHGYIRINADYRS